MMSQQRISTFLLIIASSFLFSYSDVVAKQAIDKVEITTVEPSAADINSSFTGRGCRKYPELDIDFIWVEREMNRTWREVQKILKVPNLEPPRISFDCIPRKPSLETFSPDEYPSTVHISWDIFLVNEGRKHTQLSGYIEWAVAHGIMHYILTNSGVPPLEQHCRMLEESYAQKFLQILYNAYHNSYIVPQGMMEINQRCYEDRVYLERQKK